MGFLKKLLFFNLTEPSRKIKSLNKAVKCFVCRRRKRCTCMCRYVTLHAGVEARGRHWVSFCIVLCVTLFKISFYLCVCVRAFVCLYFHRVCVSWVGGWLQRQKRELALLEMPLFSETESHPDPEAHCWTRLAGHRALWFQCYCMQLWRGNPDPDSSLHVCTNILPTNHLHEPLGKDVSPLSLNVLCVILQNRGYRLRLQAHKLVIILTKVR